MTDQWRELKETITELRDNDGTATQQEVCKFLANYIDVLEKQMINPIDRVLEIIDEEIYADEKIRLMEEDESIAECISRSIDSMDIIRRRVVALKRGSASMRKVVENETQNGQ